MNKNLAMQNFWDDLASDGTWTSHYEGKANIRTYNFYTRRQAVLKLLEGDDRYERILDVGCGSGDYGEVAERYKGGYFGIDYAPEMIVKAVKRHNGQPEQGNFLAGSGEELPYRDNMFDLIVAMGYIEYFDNPATTMNEIRRVLKPGGTLIMQSFKKELTTKLDDFVVEPLLALVGRPRSKPELPESWVDKQYSKRQLDKLMSRFAFRKTDHTFNNFYPFPGFMRLRYPDLYIIISEAIDRFCPRLAGFLATNYIGKYILQR